MAKKLKKGVEWILWLVGILIAVGVGGLFINGTFMSVVLLKYLPLTIHQIVGWVIIASTILGAIVKLVK